MILRNISSPDRSFWKPVNMTDFASVLLDRALTHWSRDQIDAISLTTFSNAFSRMKWISPTISLKFVPKVRINNTPALVQIMAWRLPGDKPLSEAMMVSLLTHICVMRPQWVKVGMLSRHYLSCTDSHCWAVYKKISECLNSDIIFANERFYI